MNITTACRDISELHPIAQKACKLFLDECKRAGLDIFITETYRSQERQNYLYEQGRTRPGKVVTWTRNSNHKSRLAWDIACNKPSLYDVATIKKAGQIAMSLGIGWGGVWKTPDMPHFEVTTNWVVPINKEEVKVAATAEAKVMLNDNKSVPAIIIDGRTYVQIRELSELLGLKLVYNNESKTTKLYTK